MRPWSVFAFQALLAACAFAWGSGAHAQAYPNRPIKMVVPYAAGGFSDQASRILVEGMSRALGQPIVIDNRAGGGGRIGSDMVSRANPDGYQLLMTTLHVAQRGVPQSASMHISRCAC